MSMDQLNRELIAFLTNLHQFNQSVAQDWDRLQLAWQQVEQVWNKDDETRRRFEKDWGEMADALHRYRHQQAQHYEEFLTARKRALDHYYGKR
jgi:hypothetical protein